MEKLIRIFKSPQGITPHYTLDTIDDFFNVSKVEQFINEYYR